MGIQEKVNGVRSKDISKKLFHSTGDETLAALEEGWTQYKENLRTRRLSHSPVKKKYFMDQEEEKQSPTTVLHQAVREQACPGKKKAYILSIDGGGMRGIIPARVLTYLEEALKKKTGNPDARIADFFDIIAGTSVGGLIATMLVTDDGKGRPMFSSEEAWKLIAEKGKRIFRIPPLKRPLAKFRGILTPRYSTKGMESILKERLAREGRDLTLKDTVKPLLIPCYDLASAGAFLFSRAGALQTDSFDFKLADVCRATSAVPGFFRPSRLTSVDGKTSVVGIDGGLVMNNPAAAAVTHVLHNSADFPDIRSVADVVVLSLGTGLFDRSYTHEQVRGWGAFQWAKPVARIVLDGISDMVDHSMSMAFSHHRPNYVRVQVSGLPGRCLTEMDDASSTNVKKLTKIADDLLSQRGMEHIPFGGKRQLSVTNKERLDHLVDCLIAEQRARGAILPPVSPNSDVSATV